MRIKALVPAPYEPREGDIVVSYLSHNPQVDTLEDVGGSALAHGGSVVEVKPAVLSSAPELERVGT